MMPEPRCCSPSAVQPAAVTVRSERTSAIDAVVILVTTT